MGSQGSGNSRWVVFDDCAFVEDIPVSSLLDPTAFASPTWPPHLSFPASTSLRVRYESCSISNSKACREKMRRDRLNGRFLELSSILDPGRLPKMEKAVILGDAVRMLSQLQGEAQKLKESKENLLEKINELKEEKNELRDEKQRLKTEKEKIELQAKALSTQSGGLPHYSAIPATFSAPDQFIGDNPVPFIGYPGVSMWQFMPPSSFDTSQDHVLRPPVA
ncbi:hypothetical protein I3760_09G079500 [Carya illinoinensis]|nr:hypothetical protein I3760_09G079500 [Carya illinoinensis]